MITMDNNVMSKKKMAWKRFQKLWITLCTIAEVLIFAAMVACDANGYTETSRWLFILMFPTSYVYAQALVAIHKRIQELDDINHLAWGVVDKVESSDADKIIHALKVQLGTISEYLVSESKQELTPEETVQAIRKYLVEHQNDVEKLEEGEDD